MPCAPTMTMKVATVAARAMAVEVVLPAFLEAAAAIFERNI